jgi:hypothetical protein
LITLKRLAVQAVVAISLTAGVPAFANKLASSGQAQVIGKSDVRVLPQTDWNKLSARPGPQAEVWTFDGELLNAVTFYTGIPSGKPLLKEKDKKNRPLPKFAKDMLLPDLPGFLDRTYRVTKDVSTFDIESVAPGLFAGRKGVTFKYAYVGSDDVRRKGEASAAVIDGKLYMVTYEAPLIFFYDNSLAPYRQLVGSLTMGKAK